MKLCVKNNFGLKDVEPTGYWFINDKIMCRMEEDGRFITIYHKTLYLEAVGDEEIEKPNNKWFSFINKNKHNVETVKKKRWYREDELVEVYDCNE